METSQAEWEQWEYFLQQKHLLGLAVFFFEAAAPLRILAAQSMYILQPLVGNSKITRLAKLLEDDEASKQFLLFLNHRKINDQYPQ